MLRIIPLKQIIRPRVHCASVTRVRQLRPSDSRRFTLISNAKQTASSTQHDTDNLEHNHTATNIDFASMSKNLQSLKNIGKQQNKDAFFNELTQWLEKIRPYFLINHESRFGYTQVQLSATPKSLFKDSNGLYLNNKLARKTLATLKYTVAAQFPTSEFFNLFFREYQDGTNFFEDYTGYLNRESKSTDCYYLLIAVLALKFRHSNQLKVLLLLKLLDAIDNLDLQTIKTIVVNLISFENIDLKLLAQHLRQHSKEINANKDFERNNLFGKQIIESLDQHFKDGASNPHERQKAVTIASFLNIVDRLEHSSSEITQKFVTNLYLHILIGEGKLLMAARSCLKHADQILDPATSYSIISSQTLTDLINMLLIPHPLYDELYIDAIVKLMFVFKYKLSYKQSVTLFEKALDAHFANIIDNSSPTTPPAMANKIFRFILDNFDEKNKQKLQEELDSKFHEIKNNTHNKFSDIQDKKATKDTVKLLDKYKVLDFQKFLRYANELIRYNIETNNIASAYSIWATIREYKLDLTSYDIDTIALLINTFRKNERFKSAAREMIMGLPVELFKNEKLNSTLLKFAAKRRDIKLGKIAIENIIKPFSRPIMTSLLSFYLSIGDEKSTEKILNDIFQSNAGLQPAEFNLIINFMLKKGLTSKAYDMISQNDKKLSMSSYISFLNHMVEQRNINVNVAEDFVIRLYQCYESNYINFKDKTQLCYLSMIYLKYITMNHNLHLAKQIYLNSIFENDDEIDLKNVPEFFCTKKQEYNLEASLVSKNYADRLILEDVFAKNFMSIPFNEPEEKVRNLRLYIPNRLKILALLHIADAAKKQLNGPIFVWCIELLLKHGSEGIDILVEFSRKYSSQLIKLGFDLPVFSESLSSGSGSSSTFSPGNTKNNNSYMKKSADSYEAVTGRHGKTLLSVFVDKNSPLKNPNFVQRFKDPEKMKVYESLKHDKNLLFRRFWELEGDKFVKKFIS